MGAEMKIQWCHHTFNPVRGCAKISEGCEHCYAATMSRRNPNLLGVWGRSGTRIVASADMWKQPVKWNDWARKSRLFQGEAWKQWGESSTMGVPESRRILAGILGETRKFTPGEWTALPPFRPRVFCASLADLFEDWTGMMHFYRVDEETERPAIGCAWYVPELGVVPSGKTSPHYSRKERHATFQDVRDQTFALIEKTPHLDWMLLTKRPENVMRMVPDSWRAGFPENVWIGATAENQKRFEERYEHLCEIPAKVRFWSMEPLLESIDFTAVHDARTFKYYFDWVICGGESGPGARECHTDDVRDIVSQCELAGVPCFVKQLGSNAVAAGRDQKQLISMKHPKGGDPAEWPEDLRMREFPRRQPSF